MMLKIKPLFVLLILTTSLNVQSGAVVPGKEKRQMTEEEIKSSIGRMGEVDEIPEGFEFSEMEQVLWQSPHLENISEPTRLLYQFTKSGTYEEGFEDSVFLEVVKFNEDGTKNTNLEFFTDERKQFVRPENVNNIIGNPVLGIYMQGDVYEMDRYTGGSWRHFMKRLKMSFRDGAKIENISFTHDGKEYTGKKYSVRPYLDDPRRTNYEKFANKIYEFVFSDDIPGKLYQIRTVIDGEKEGDKPLVLEELTFIDEKNKA